MIKLEKGHSTHILSELETPPPLKLSHGLASYVYRDYFDIAGSSRAFAGTAERMHTDQEQCTYITDPRDMKTFEVMISK